MSMWVRWVFVAFGLACAATGWAQSVLAVPPLTAHVMDSTGTLDAGAKLALENKLTAFEASQGTQIVVLVVPTTGRHCQLCATRGRQLEDWAQRCR
jgi:uncharacterized membrane protein YgcG